ncbi:hypothetical protein [Sporosarcina sp. G11-34]|uniref:hypothetical protein n=1 Tax=Sporosarcina sp. G11-34 TaxID=2849605 RepID=UPI0022A918F5|nr:hypothetical protein [Sporosarcina sp. G11-34]MCZ2257420.1 hypothetical protein [Sporosarcina sp. G11-34]
MKKIAFMSIFSVILLLSGCVSIPLTDGGSIEISADGVTISPAEEDTETEDVTEVVVEDETPSTIEEKDPTEEENAPEKSEVVNEVDVEVKEQEQENTIEPDEVEGLGGCANEFYLLENRLPKGFPIPPCTYIRHLEILEDDEENERIIIANYDTPGSIEEETEVYKTFFEDAGYSFTVNSQTEKKSELAISGKGIEMTMNSSQTEEDTITMQIAYNETPIQQYEITKSIINHTGNGYGKCSDEFYTALGILTDDFPLPECAKIKFLQIKNHDSAIQAVVIYEVNRYWTEEFDVYENYIKDNNFLVIKNEGIATYGELEFEKGDILVSLTNTKMGMEKTETHINITENIDE